MKKIVLFFLLLFPFYSHAQIITTIVGIDSQAYSGDGGPAIDAGLDGPFTVALDGEGNYYIADGYNNHIRKVNAAGIITNFAGNDTAAAGYNGDGIPATDAELYHPVGITCDHSGNIYFTDAFNNRVRKIDTTGIITTVAGNGTSGYNGDNILADSAELDNPWGIAVDANRNLYISDYHRIRKVNTSGIIITIAGTGTAGYTGDNGLATAAEINIPYGITLDGTGNIYFADYPENVVRKIDTFGIITTFVGTGFPGFSGDNGPADSAELSNPAGLAIDGSGNVYIADGYNNRVRKVTVASGIITTIAGDGVEGYSGDGGLATLAELSEPAGVTIDATGNMYITDFGNNLIRYVSWPSSVNQLSSTIQSLLVYPNPSFGLFTVSITAGTNEKVLLTITNVLGETIKEISAYTNTPLIVQLDQPSGTYFLSAVSAHGTTNKTISIK